MIVELTYFGFNGKYKTSLTYETELTDIDEIFQQAENFVRDVRYNKNRSDILVTLHPVMVKVPNHKFAHPFLIL